MNDTQERPISIGNWILTFIILAIPLLNIIMLIVWAVGSETHPSKKTYAQASLILFGVVIVIAIVIGILAAVMGVSAPSEVSY